MRYKLAAEAERTLQVEAWKLAAHLTHRGAMHHGRKAKKYKPEDFYRPKSSRQKRPATTASQLHSFKRALLKGGG